MQSCFFVNFFERGFTATMPKTVGKPAIIVAIGIMLVFLKQHIKIYCIEVVTVIINARYDIDEIVTPSIFLFLRNEANVLK